MSSEVCEVPSPQKQMGLWSVCRKLRRTSHLWPDPANEKVYGILSAGGVHISSLPKSVRGLARTVLTAAMVSFAAMKAGMPPSIHLWREIMDLTDATIRREQRSTSNFYVAGSLRKIVSVALRNYKHAPETHGEMDSRLTAIMYWCCLGHPGCCIVSHLYEENSDLIKLLGMATGCGESPLTEVESYWKPLCRAVAAKGNALIYDDVEVAHYLINVRQSSESSPPDDGEDIE
ncbi:US10 protein [Gallid alphaherpesvirus 3]|uniref:US10 protein n=2 Tax=Gallid alphaherpesvirus 3 TaxID=35250 RepID=Q782M9_9ALPH|nr:virion protein US10 [Gallid alphaherpesvirus 3]YP_010795683.1 US10 protein [Gallid alphaherpesvirus 3]AEI00292.1 US10 protein [Gallid alphaherpesvirus 3]BAA32007.1 US10 [Marek's disease virus serotype 2 MDV2]BAB16586.1 US10 protein [Gallid alphaherpesvirus 3]